MSEDPETDECGFNTEVCYSTINLHDITSNVTMLLIFNGHSRPNKKFKR